MPKFTQYIVSTMEIDIGSTYDFISAGTIYRDATLVAANYDDSAQDMILTVSTTAGGLEAISYNDTVPILPAAPIEALDVPSATQQITTQKISYLLGWQSLPDTFS